MIQCFVKKRFTPTFTDGKLPKLFYVCKNDAANDTRPRIMHSHDDTVEILLIRSGTGVYVIGDKRYPVTPGDMIICNSGVLHDEVAETTIGISTYCCAATSVHLPNLPSNTLLPESMSPLLHCGDMFEKINDTFRMMFDEVFSGKPQSEEIAQYLLQALLIMICRLIDDTAVKHGETEDNPILGERIRSYINANYKEDICLNTIASALKISPFYLSHVFKQTTGYSPMQYISRRRIGEAQTLLISTKIPITKIAAMVGYGNPSHFNVIFTKYIGMAPRKYRQTWQTEPNAKIDSKKSKV